MKKFFKVILKILFWLILFTVIISVFCFFYFKPTKNPAWGVNFSPDQARYLKIDPFEIFNAILIDLKVRKVRLVAYWENIEKEKGKYDFSETEKLLNLAEKSGAKVIFVVGRKQPRWPECHQPEWYWALNDTEKKQALESFVKSTVNYFKNNSAIERWQVENEPFFNYGKDCPIMNKKDLRMEIQLVKNLDSKPVVITDSGEKGDWFKAGDLADVFGTTMYRTVYNPRWGGYITYPLPPAWYRIRAGLLQIVNPRKPVIGVELQAEPWFNGNVNDLTIEKHLELMDAENLEKNINYAKKTGLSEHYFWGVEWWFFMKKKNHPEFWTIIQQLNKN